MDLNRMNEDWKEDAPKLAAMEKTNPFTVPDNYFHDLSEQLLARVRIEDIATRESSAIFNVPDHYFETLEERISASIAVDKLREEVLQDGFSVPEGYFTKLEDDILQKTTGTPGKEAKVRTLFPQWIKYAAAACITAVISFGIYNYTKPTSDMDTQFSSLPEEEIVSYLQAYSTPADGAVLIEQFQNEDAPIEMQDELSEKEIEEYLESTL